MRQRLLRLALSTALVGSLVGATAGNALASSGSPGDDTITITITDSHAGGSYDQVFEKAYANTTTSGTPVYIYVPEGAVGDATVDSVNPAFDHNPGDEFTPCADKTPEQFLMTAAQIESLGDELTDQIVAVDEAHYGEIGLADPSDPNSDALVVLAYNVQDEAYYDCSVNTYTAGYFAPEYITDAGMNVIVLDSFDWANRTGDQTGNEDGQSFLYEGVIAHELEHLLMNYSDSGELSWVDEGLADMAAFLNGYPPAGSHFTYHQVFHRETSLTRWGGGLENYGASLSYFLYLWEQAGGNGDGTLDADLEYDGAGGDLLIKLIFAEQADSLEGVQNAIDDFNAQTGSSLRSAEDLFKDWALAIYLDDPDSDLFDIKNVDFGQDSGNWTISIANDVFFGGRGQYKGATPNAFFLHNKDVPQQSALPYGTSYETFRNPGPTFKLDLSGADTSEVAPHTGDTHWYANYESMDDNILNVDETISGGEEIDFWTWYFIEQDFDYGFVEALVNGDWETVEVFDDADHEVTTDFNPFGNNTEGNGLTGTSGGVYFVDDPEYIHLHAELPAGATDVRFRYSTDAAYLDTGWFVDDVSVDGAAATLSSDPANWFETNGEQDNHFIVQIVSSCDLTPGTTSAGEIQDPAGFVYRFAGDEIHQTGFSTKCMNSTKASVLVVISNLPTGDLTTLDAGYMFRVTNTSNKK
jgi:immune inhibitor InhA-like protein